MRDLDSLFVRLATSRFRSRFRLGEKEHTYLATRGLPIVLDHAADFVEKRRAPAEPANYGKQTSMRGHPVFFAQHATATCCRSCLANWPGIPAGGPLNAAESRNPVAAMARWLAPGIGRAQD